MSDAAIDCRGLWKIFGEREAEALTAARELGLNKQEILQEYDAVVGVADASFTVQQGEIFCIMGLSGSGKSTLVRHINRLIEPTEGEILVEGENVSDMNPAQLRDLRARKMGMVFQNMALLPHRDVSQNVSLSLELRGESREACSKAAQEKLDLVHLTGWGERYPDELSGGMQQRVGLARALAADPDILLMDEPFSALDPLIRRQLQDQFLELASVMNKTTIFITHDLDEAIRLGNHIAIMKDGRLVQIGTPEEIVTEPADAYVADFVQGISRLKIVRAHKVMMPAAQYGAENGGLPDGAPIARPDADLNELINLSNAHDNQPVVIKDDTGAEIGVVTTAVLLRGIQGATATEEEKD